jgi:hypothetical protein
VPAALDAAKQLSSIWRTGRHAKLLQRPPAAAWGGKAAEAVDQSTALLQALHAGLIYITQGPACDDSAAGADRMLEKLEQHQLVGLLARLMVWLQHLPGVRLEQSASTSNSSSGSSSTSSTSDSSSRSLLLWHWCIGVLHEVSAIVIRAWDSRPDEPELVLPHVENITCALDEAGENQGSSVLRNCGDTCEDVSAVDVW